MTASPGGVLQKDSLAHFLAEGDPSGGEGQGPGQLRVDQAVRGLCQQHLGGMSRVETAGLHAIQKRLGVSVLRSGAAGQQAQAIQARQKAESNNLRGELIKKDATTSLAPPLCSIPGQRYEEIEHYPHREELTQCFLAKMSRIYFERGGENFMRDQAGNALYIPKLNRAIEDLVDRFAGSTMRFNDRVHKAYSVLGSGLRIDDVISAMGECVTHKEQIECSTGERLVMVPMDMPPTKQMLYNCLANYTAGAGLVTPVTALLNQGAAEELAGFHGIEDPRLLAVRSIRKTLNMNSISDSEDHVTNLAQALRSCTYDKDGVASTR